MRAIASVGLLVLLAANAKAISPDEMMQATATTTPHPRQVTWQECEFTCFIHFGVNTFTGREWGTGKESPELFQPTELDTDQWCRAMKAAGMKLVVFTAKHHDGFCLWQTRYTDHSVASSSWRSGQGDVLRELSESCLKHGLRLGVYLSPADLYQIESPTGLYGNGSKYTERAIPRPVNGRPFQNQQQFRFSCDDYNEYFMSQLFELLTEYGPIHEVWFDGAHPKRKGGQTYTHHQWYELIRALAPDAVIAVKGPDVRWCGNEAGATRDSEWSVIPLVGSLDTCQWPDLQDRDLGSLDRIRETLGRGGFLHWYPAETNTSIRDGWFWRDEQQHVRPASEILDIWYRSVGGNTVFLLNVPPDNRGRFGDRDVHVLETVGAAIRQTFAANLATNASFSASSNVEEFPANNVADLVTTTSWMPTTDDPTPTITLAFDSEQTFNRIVLQEQISTHSQRIASFVVEAWIDGQWQAIAHDTVVGYKRICRIPTITTRQLRLRVLESRLNPTVSEFGLYLDTTSP